MRNFIISAVAIMLLVSGIYIAADNFKGDTDLTSDQDQNLNLNTETNLGSVYGDQIENDGVNSPPTFIITGIDNLKLNDNSIIYAYVYDTNMSDILEMTKTDGPEWVKIEACIQQTEETYQKLSCELSALPDKTGTFPLTFLAKDNNGESTELKVDLTVIN